MKSLREGTPRKNREKKRGSERQKDEVIRLLGPLGKKKKKNQSTRYRIESGVGEKKRTPRTQASGAFCNFKKAMRKMKPTPGQNGNVI